MVGANEPVPDRDPRGDKKVTRLQVPAVAPRRRAPAWLGLGLELGLGLGFGLGLELGFGFGKGLGLGLGLARACFGSWPSACSACAHREI